MIKFILKYGEKVTRLQIFYFSPSKQFSKNSIVKNYYCSNCLRLPFIKIPRFIRIIYFSFICASNLPKFSTLWLKLNSILLFFSSVYNFPLYNKRSRNAACYLNKFQLEKLRKPRKIIANNDTKWMKIPFEPHIEPRAEEALVRFQEMHNRSFATFPFFEPTRRIHMERKQGRGGGRLDGKEVKCAERALFK